MSKRRSTVTISIHWEGDPESQLYHMPAWLFKTLAIGSVVFVVLVGIAAVLYTPIVRTAARVPGLNSEIARLTEENNQVQTLAATLQDLEHRYDQIRNALGAAKVPEALTAQRQPQRRLIIGPLATGDHFARERARFILKSRHRLEPRQAETLF